MKISDENKTLALLDEIAAINKKSFSGIELPSEKDFAFQVHRNDVFVRRFDIMQGIGFGPIVTYAIVEQRLGCPFIWQIATDPQWRGHGYAADALGEMALYYEGRYPCIELCVHVENFKAQVLYLKNGYRVAKFMRDYYRPEGDGLLFRRIL